MSNENSRENDDLDPGLAALFRREHTHLPAEPFASSMLQVIARERRRAALHGRLLTVAAVVALLLLLPRLVAVSIWLSARLDELFALVAVWLGSPLGIVAAVLGGIVALATKWARVW